jgi:uncharacterized protein YjiS (DUF1127 family)
MSNIPLALSQPWLCVARWGGGLRQLRNTVRLALRVHGERRALRGLDERTLKDLGFSRGVADSESCRAFWDLPADRRLT